MKNIITLFMFAACLMVSQFGYAQDGGDDTKPGGTGGDVVSAGGGSGGGGGNGDCSDNLTGGVYSSLDVVGEAGSVIDLWGGTETGWNNQIRFFNQCIDSDGGAKLQHVIATHGGRQSLVIYPGFNGNGADVLEIAGKVTIGSTLTPSQLPSGTPLPGYKLFVNGGILADEVRVASPWADYVFYDDYKLPSLQEVKAFIDENNHLPNVTPAKDIEEGGLPLGEMMVQQQVKIEELFLYMIEMEERLEKLEVENKVLRAQLEE